MKKNDIKKKNYVEDCAKVYDCKYSQTPRAPTPPTIDSTKPQTSKEATKLINNRKMKLMTIVIASETKIIVLDFSIESTSCASPYALKAVDMAAVYCARLSCEVAFDAVVEFDVVAFVVAK
jgi:hypothetical protein